MNTPSTILAAALAAAIASPAAAAIPTGAERGTIEPISVDLPLLEPIVIEPVGIERSAQWHPEAERLMERLKRQSDDGTLNSQDYRRVQRLHRELSDARAIDTGTTDVPVRVAANPPEVEALIERLERRSDDGTLNEQDQREVRKLYQELRS